MSSDTQNDAAEQVKDQHEPQQDIETPTESHPTAAERFTAEGREGMAQLVSQANEERQRIASGGRSGISGAFGKPVLEGFGADSDVKATLADKPRATKLEDDTGMLTPLAYQPGSDKLLGDKAATKTVDDDKTARVAAYYEADSRRALANAHKDLKYTTDGSPPKVVEYRDKFTVTSEKSALDIAKEQLGDKATKEQLERYANELAAQNGKIAVNLEDVKFDAGSVIKLPGQTADGGIIFRTPGGGTTTVWSDNSRMDVSEDGSGQVLYREPDKTMVTESWNPKSIKLNTEVREKDFVQVTKRGDGITTTEKYIETNKATGDGDWKTTKIESGDDKGNIIVQDFDPGASKPKSITVVSPLGDTVEYLPGKGGEYLSKDGRFGITPDLQSYKRETGKDSFVTRTYDTGRIEKCNPAGRIVHIEDKDSWGRACTYDFLPGQQQPYKATITPKPGEDPIEFKRQPNNSYKADYLDASKKKIGTIELGADGRLTYINDATKTARAELKDGTTVETTKLPSGESKKVYTKGSDSLVIDYDNKGNQVTQTYTGADGRKLIKTFVDNGKKVDTVTIEEPGNIKTELKYDKNAAAFKGERKDASGTVVETVTLQEDKFVYTDVKTSAVRAEKYLGSTEEKLIPTLLPGTYDRDSGTFTYENDDKSKSVESFSPGRTDRIRSDGAVDGRTATGETSTVKPSGEATVLHSDRRGVRLNANGTIDRWGPNESDNATGEALSPAEDRYLRGHPDVDRRALAEIHERMAGDITKLDAFYNALEKVDTARNLTDAEKQALRRDLMHHVAHPAEIYQGRSPSCNVSVVERDMAISQPDKYVATVVNAVSDSSLTLADGTTVPMDPTNLKMSDSSGRDLASRIFQSAALQAEFYPDHEFRNTEDGVGRIYTAPYDPSEKPLTFAGLFMPHIADVRYKLTGDEKAVTRVSNVDELLAAYDNNGGPPMIVAVDGNRDPFNSGGPVGTDSNVNHVVTITRIDKGPPVKVYIQNQWGLDSDHSTRETAVDGAKLVDNMKVRKMQGGKVVAGDGIVLSSGDHSKYFEVTNGRMVENEKGSKAVVLARRLVPQPGDA